MSLCRGAHAASTEGGIFHYVRRNLIKVQSFQIAAIERGEKVPSFEAMDKLANSLKVRLYELFLPIHRDEALNQSLRQLMRKIDEESTPSMKRFLAVILPLVGQLQADLHEEYRGRG